MNKRILFSISFAIVLLVVAVIYITYPLIFFFDSYTTGLGDELLIAWIQNWVLHAIFNTPGSLFDANIYFPYSNTLAYSETFITSSLFALLVKLFSSEPIVTVNFTFVSSLFSLGFGVFILSYYISKNYLSSIIAGLLVIFSPAVLSYSTHLQVLGIAGVPLAILFFYYFLIQNKSKYFLIACVFFVLQIYNSFLPGYFIIFSFLIILILFSIFYKIKVRRIFLTKNIFIACITLLISIPVVVPYYQVSKEFDYKRDIRESIHNSFQFEDFLYPGQTTILKDTLLSIPINNYSQNEEYKPGYLGFIFSALTIVVFSYFLYCAYKRKISFKVIVFGCISLMALILSLGPVLHLNRHTVHDPFIIPLPYSIFYYLAPGFQGFRTPSRWLILFIISNAVLISIILHMFLKRFSTNKQLLLFCFFVFGIVIEFTQIKYYQVPRINNFPKIYSWIATTPRDSVIIEMPIFTWDMQPYVFQENYREYYSTVHFRKMVNGASGFSPPPWQDMAKNLLLDFPNENTVSKLSDLNVNYIIIHTSEYDLLHKDKFTYNGKTVGTGDDIIQQLNKNKSLKFIKKIEDDYVYELRK